MRRVLGAFSVVLVSVLGASGSVLSGPAPAGAQTVGAQTAGTQNPGSPTTVDPRVLVIGDSVLLGAEGALRARLWGVPMTFFAQVSFSTTAAPAVIDFNRAAIGDVTIIALGENDGADPAYFARAIDDVMAALGPVRKVLWVNMRQFRDWVPAANIELNAAAQRYPNLQIVDWDGRATPDPSLVYADGLHLNPAGQAAMAELVGNSYDAAVRELGAPAPAPVVPPPPSAVIGSGGTSNANANAPFGGKTGAPAETAAARVAAVHAESRVPVAPSAPAVAGTSRGIDIVLTTFVLATLVAIGIFVRRLVVVRRRVMIRRRHRLDLHPTRPPGPDAFPPLRA